MSGRKQAHYNKYSWIIFFVIDGFFQHRFICLSSYLLLKYLPKSKSESFLFRYKTTIKIYCCFGSADQLLALCTLALYTRQLSSVVWFRKSLNNENNNNCRTTDNHYSVRLLEPTTLLLLDTLCIFQFNNLFTIKRPLQNNYDIFINKEGVLCCKRQYTHVFPPGKDWHNFFGLVKSIRSAF